MGEWRFGRFVPREPCRAIDPEVATGQDAETVRSGEIHGEAAVLKSQRQRLECRVGRILAEGDGEFHSNRFIFGLVNQLAPETVFHRLFVDSLQRDRCFEPYLPVIIFELVGDHDRVRRVAPASERPDARGSNQGIGAFAGQNPVEIDVGSFAAEGRIGEQDHAAALQTRIIEIRGPDGGLKWGRRTEFFGEVLEVFAHGIASADQQDGPSGHGDQMRSDGRRGSRHHSDQPSSLGVQSGCGSVATLGER